MLMPVNSYNIIRLSYYYYPIPGMHRLSTNQTSYYNDVTHTQGPGVQPLVWSGGW